MNKTFINALIRILVVLGIFLAIRFLSKELVGLVCDWLSNVYSIEFKYESSLYKLFMVLFSVIIMLLSPGYTLRDFGFCVPENVKYFKIIWLTFVVVIGGMIVFGSVYMGLLRNIIGDGTEPLAGMGGGQSFLTIVLSIWLWSSITEEIYTRGLFQSLLDKLKKYRFLRLSVPVWLSGLAFGLLHISIYEPGKLFFTMFVVSQAITLGLLAAYYREKSRSLYPSIMVHVLGNIYGSVMQFIA